MLPKISQLPKKKYLHTLHGKWRNERQFSNKLPIEFWAGVVMSFLANRIFCGDCFKDFS
jgi:hypothetical protein